MAIAGSVAELATGVDVELVTPGTKLYVGHNMRHMDVARRLVAYFLGNQAVDAG
ncbi:hypothetical protein [Tessaracoccus massiliensis]|uniref:hypothetical protein n=1 Tax=Tessaracoccus massiliensis TaxID=1522311 RepID=UPI000A731929|nr:hypothetical protein [Tessaracoccus massiliensis]